MNTAVTPYDRLLISLAVAALSAVVLTGRARAEDAGPRMDRYGGETVRLQPAPELRPVPVAYTVASAAGLRGPLPLAGPQPFAGRALSWAGKSEILGAQPAYAPTAAPALQPAPLLPSAPVFEAARARPAPPPTIYAPVAPEERRPAAAAAPRRAAPKPAKPMAAPASQAVAAPTPEKAAPVAAAQPPAAAPAPRAAQAYAGGSVRHYSVHREFGISPDPTPIPPQFFTATADLSAADVGSSEPLPRTPPSQTGTGRSGVARTVTPANPT